MDSDDPSQNPSQEASQQLFAAIAFMDHPGVRTDFAGDIRAALAAGADINGPNEDGETPLTEAIIGGAGSPSAVRLLLDLGADPNRRNREGWSPWALCLSRQEDPVVAEDMLRIRALLEDAGADRSDEALLDFLDAITAGNRSAVQRFLERGLDPDTPMLTALDCAIDTGDAVLVRLFLDAGLDPNGRDPDEPALIRAARLGDQALAELLLRHGADLQCYGWRDSRYTADVVAHEHGHQALAYWFAERLGKPDPALSTESLDKFGDIYEHGVACPDMGLATEDIVARLQRWDEMLGIDVSEVTHSGFQVVFASLPADLEAFATDVDEFCPDIIAQGYGCMDEVLERYRNSGQVLPNELAQLVEGVDMSRDDLGFELLKRDLSLNHQLKFWWD